MIIFFGMAAAHAGTLSGSVELAMGSYVVQIIQGDRAARFNVAVPDKGIVTQSFKLTW